MNERRPIPTDHPEPGDTEAARGTDRGRGKLLGHWTVTWRWLIMLAPGLWLWVSIWRQPPPSLSNGTDALLEVLAGAGALAFAFGTLGLLVPIGIDSRRCAAIAGAAGVLGGGLVLASIVSRSSVDPGLVSYPALLVAVLALACSGWVSYDAGVSWGRPLSSAWAAAGAGLLGALFGFWTQYSFEPSQERPTLEATIDIEQVSRTDDGVRSLVSVALRNPGNVRTVNVISALTVCHAQDARSAIRGRRERRREALGPVDDRAPGCTYHVPFASLSWTDPGGGSRIVYAVETPVDAPYVDVELTMHYARGDRLREAYEDSRPASRRELADACSDGEVIPLRDDSRIEGYAGETPTILLYTREDGSRNYAITTDAHPRCGSHSQTGLERFLSITEKHVRHETWTSTGPPPRSS